MIDGVGALGRHEYPFFLLFLCCLQDWMNHGQEKGIGLLFGLWGRTRRRPGERDEWNLGLASVSRICASPMFQFDTRLKVSLQLLSRFTVAQRYPHLTWHAPIHVLPKNAGFCSIVADMNPLNAAHRFDVPDGCTAACVCVCVCVPACVSIFSCPTAVAARAPVAAAPAAETFASCAKLRPNRSISPFTSLSFLLSAPGRVLRLLCRTLPCRACSASIASPVATSSSISAWMSSSASPSDSSVATSFLLGRRRFVCELPEADFLEDLATRERKAECLIRRLSALESMKPSETTLSARWSLRGRRGSARRARAFWRAVGRLEGAGAVGAWGGRLG